MESKHKLLNIISRTVASVALIMGCTMGSFAQKSAVLDAFLKHNIDTGILHAENVKLPGDLSFELKETTITSQRTDVIMAAFDHKKNRTEQWTVVSVNEHPPSKSKIRSFRKDHSNNDETVLYDDETYKVEKESPDYLVISYKQHLSSNSEDAAYMKDCRLYMTVNLKTKRLEQVQVRNEKPIRIKVIITAKTFDLVTKYLWHEQTKRYVPVNKTLNLTADVLGQSAFVQTISDYSNYGE